MYRGCIFSWNKTKTDHKIYTRKILPLSDLRVVLVVLCLIRQEGHSLLPGTCPHPLLQSVVLSSPHCHMVLVVAIISLEAVTKILTLKVVYISLERFRKLWWTSVASHLITQGSEMPIHAMPYWFQSTRDQYCHFRV